MPSVEEAAKALWMVEHSLRCREWCVPLWLHLPPFRKLRCSKCSGGLGVVWRSWVSESRDLFLEGTGLGIFKSPVYHLGSCRRIDVPPLSLDLVIGEQEKAPAFLLPKSFCFKTAVSLSHINISK